MNQPAMEQCNNDEEISDMIVLNRFVKNRRVQKPCGYFGRLRFIRVEILVIILIVSDKSVRLRVGPDRVVSVGEFPNAMGIHG